ncbi:hypothetical protein QR685DRAFT_568692 [Neurospora intermedia]|uniref:Uncharacterized protein n=1 Tax=Neurospora intermedia TaxID=5142 RepID=A0ABR3DTS3_NEUIN
MPWDPTKAGSWQATGSGLDAKTFFEFAFCFLPGLCTLEDGNATAPRCPNHCSGSVRNPNPRRVSLAPSLAKTSALVRQAFRQASTLVAKTPPFHPLAPWSSFAPPLFMHPLTSPLWIRGAIGLFSACRHASPSHRVSLRGKHPSAFQHSLQQFRKNQQE